MLLQTALSAEPLTALLSLGFVPFFSALLRCILSKEHFPTARIVCAAIVFACAGLEAYFVGLSCFGLAASVLFSFASMLYGNDSSLACSRFSLLPALFGAAFGIAAVAVASGLRFTAPQRPLPFWAGSLLLGAGIAVCTTVRIKKENVVWLRAAAPVFLPFFFMPLAASDAALAAGFLIPAAGALFERFRHSPFRYVTGEEQKLLRDSVPINFYNNVLCLRHPMSRFTSAASFFFILLNANRGSDRRYYAGTDTVKHEYGHILQAKALGAFRFWRYIALPSMSGYARKVPYAEYYNQPWERGADLLGGVKRSVHAADSEQKWHAYFLNALPERKRAILNKQNKNKEGTPMIRFMCDYQEGACPEIMAALQETNYEQSEGYGEDRHCANARALIQQACGRDDADVHFLIGGTSCNKILIAAALRPFEGALCVQTAHINAHETGTIEASGHKVLALPSPNGKLTAQQVESTMAAHWADATHEHIVRPGLVYITHPTEGGLLYTLEELTELRKACDRWGLYLYLDGARLGYGLAAEGTDVTLKDIARLTDAFYIGGTKVGALFGEAMVLLHPALKKDFRYMIKNQGGLLAKGRLQGLQFEALFTDGLYEKLGAHAVRLAMRVRAVLREKNIPVLYDSPTNQQFPIFTDAQLKKLSEKYVFEAWGAPENGMNPMRICMSWATKEEHVSALTEDIRAL